MKRERKLYKNRKVKIENFAPHPQVFHFIPLTYHFIPLRYPRIAKLSTTLGSGCWELGAGQEAEDSKGQENGARGMPVQVSARSLKKTYSLPMKKVTKKQPPPAQSERWLRSTFKRRLFCCGA